MGFEWPVGTAQGLPSPGHRSLENLWRARAARLAVAIGPPFGVARFGLTMRRVIHPVSVETKVQIFVVAEGVGLTLRGRSSPAIFLARRLSARMVGPPRTALPLRFARTLPLTGLRCVLRLLFWCRLGRCCAGRPFYGSRLRGLRRIRFVARGFIARLYRGNRGFQLDAFR